MPVAFAYNPVFYPNTTVYLYVADTTPETKVIPDTALPAENVCSCNNDIMKEAELKEADKNIVEDMYEVNKIINQEFNLIKNKEK